MRRIRGPYSLIGTGIMLLFFSMWTLLTGQNVPSLRHPTLHAVSHNQAMFGVCLGVLLAALGGVWLWFVDE